MCRASGLGSIKKITFSGCFGGLDASTPKSQAASLLTTIREQDKHMM